MKKIVLLMRPIKLADLAVFKSISRAAPCLSHNMSREWTLYSKYLHI